jgi:hypothetical protein
MSRAVWWLLLEPLPNHLACLLCIKSHPESLDSLAELSIVVWDWDSMSKNDFMYATDRVGSNPNPIPSQPKRVERLKEMCGRILIRSIHHKGTNNSQARQRVPGRIAWQAF